MMEQEYRAAQRGEERQHEVTMMEMLLGATQNTAVNTIPTAFQCCVVPENIHTPTTEGIGHSGGVAGSKTQEIPEGRGVG